MFDKMARTVLGVEEPKLLTPEAFQEEEDRYIVSALIRGWRGNIAAQHGSIMFEDELEMMREKIRKEVRDRNKAE